MSPLTPTRLTPTRPSKNVASDTNSNHLVSKTRAHDARYFDMGEISHRVLHSHIQRQFVGEKTLNPAAKAQTVAAERNVRLFNDRRGPTLRERRIHKRHEPVTLIRERTPRDNVGVNKRVVRLPVAVIHAAHFFLATPEVVP